ncbi:MAG TPA: L-arabinose isomerase, partial [Nitriliruptoraceae bacterium]|nr:L-arabinose isomerase [Nitriliruptoraceae bacterium]
MIAPDTHELWFVTGSQHLYGEETIQLVADNARHIATYLDDEADLALPLVVKQVMTTPDELARMVGQANADPRCAGLVLWMHTFSPARMWIRFLGELSVPWVHLHTQFARDLPWADIDMDYMNTHQAAHGDREFGHMASRLRIERKVVAGHWQDPAVGERLATWSRAAWARADARGARIGRLGDNMREVAVTEGDKVEFQRVFGYEVNGYGVGEVATRIAELDEGQITDLCSEYADTYEVAGALLPDGDRHDSLRTAAAIELGLRSWLVDEDLVGFTDTFEDLHGLAQLPGIAAQRLMADGYGFGAEGDWKTAAMVRATKVMGHGRPGGTSFMEDYTYHL